MRLVFHHGWGFDSSIWNGLREALEPLECDVWDRGYFGPPRVPQLDGPVLAIGHSLGSLILAAAPPPDCAGLIAINGFDRFAGYGAVAPRSIARMRRRFSEAPAEVLGAFRERCGGTPHAGFFDPQRLSDDLERLETTDARGATRPLLVLHGEADPLLEPLMQKTVFEGSRRVTLPGAGHLLPLTHPEWCAEQIRSVLP